MMVWPLMHTADDIENVLKKKNNNNKWEPWRELNQFGQVHGS